jgi:geranylgeranyl diphosphate synthase type II
MNQHNPRLRAGPGSGHPNVRNDPFDALASATPPVVRELMREYGGLAARGVEDVLSRERPAPYLHDLLTDYPRRGGRMMRPTICIANACAFGGRVEDAIHAAASVEVLHNGMLIHDDIQDWSEMRRGKPTLHILHGVPLAINAGDAMILMSLRNLVGNLPHLGSALSLRIIEHTYTMARESAEGQALELGWRDTNKLDVTVSDYLTMVLKKTSWMSMIWPAQLGVLIGARGKIDPECVVRFGFFVGAAFQIQDDILNLSADEAYGKELNGDLYEAKRTLMLIHARDNCNDTERARIDAFLALRREDRTEDDVLWLADLMDRLGSIAYARAIAGAMAGAAQYEFSRVYGHLPASRDKDFIAGLIPWVFDQR